MSTNTNTEKEKQLDNKVIGGYRNPIERPFKQEVHELFSRELDSQDFGYSPVCLPELWQKHSKKRCYDDKLNFQEQRGGK